MIMNFLSQHIDIGIFITIIAGVFKFWQFVETKRQEARVFNFEKYHELVEKLNVNYKDEDRSPYIESQAAIIFELRNFIEYKEYSLNLFNKRLNQYDKMGKDFKEKNEILIDEIKRTKEFLTNCSLHRFFVKIKNRYL